MKKKVLWFSRHEMIWKYAYPPPIRYFKNPDSKDESK